MPDVPISAISDAGDPAGDDELPYVDTSAAATRRGTVEEVVRAGINAGAAAYRGFRGFSGTDYYEVVNASAGALLGNSSPGFELMTAAILDAAEGGGWGDRELVSAIRQFLGPGYMAGVSDARAIYGMTDGGGSRFGIFTGNWARNFGGKLLVVINLYFDGSTRAFYLNGRLVASASQTGYSAPTTPVRMGLNADTTNNPADNLTHLGFGFKSDGPMTDAEREEAIRELIKRGHFADGVFTNLYTARDLDVGAAPATLTDAIGAVNLTLTGSLTVVDDAPIGPAVYQTPAPDDAVVRSGGMLVPGAQAVSAAGPTTVSSPRVLCDSTAAAIGLTCPGFPSQGDEFRVLDTGRNASVNNITINRAGSQLINGATSYVISADGGVVSLTFDGTNWLAW